MKYIYYAAGSLKSKLCMDFYIFFFTSSFPVKYFLGQEKLECLGAVV